MRWLVSLGAVLLICSGAQAQVQQLIRDDWAVSILQNGRTGRPDGAAISEAVRVDSLSAGRAAGLLLCTNGRVRFALRWPMALSLPDRPVRFSVRIDQAEPQEILFHWTDGTIIGRSAREANYVAADDRLISQLLRGQTIVIAPQMEPRWTVQISLKGFPSANFDMTALCQGRYP